MTGAHLIHEASFLSLLWLGVLSSWIASSLSLPLVPVRSKASGEGWLVEGLKW
jgi:hypothetical protein